MIEKPISFNVLPSNPLLIIISGPSGVGKDSVVKQLTAINPGLDFAITTTSRLPRPGEKDGVDYYFVTGDQFDRMIAAGEFMEYSNVYGQQKGVTRKEVRQKWSEGKDVILRIDYQGTIKFRQMYPQVLTIFLLPTSQDELYRRLMDRGSETPETIQTRMETTREEMLNLEVFDYLVFNAHGKLDETVRKIEAIITAEHHRRQQRVINI